MRYNLGDFYFGIPLPVFNRNQGEIDDGENDNEDKDERRALPWAARWPAALTIA